MFWQQGVTATRGEDIADRAGISTRTLWRYFRAKEACVEPVLEASGSRFLDYMRGWPAAMSIEDYLRVAFLAPADEQSGDLFLAARMIALAETEPALRASWLLVCDRAERELPKLLKIRLGLDPGSREARTLAASVFGAIRAVNDELSIAVATDPTALDPIDAAEIFAHTIRTASGGRLGDPITPPTPSPGESS